MNCCHHKWQGFFFPVENCSATGAKNNNKRDTLVFRCFPLGFLAPERVIFIVVADGTCRRRTKKSLWLKINYWPAQHARTKKQKKNYYYTYCWEWNKKRVKPSSWVKTNLMSSPLRKRMRSPVFNPHSSAGLSERETRSVAGNHTSVERTKKKNGIWLSARG